MKKLTKIHSYLEKPKIRGFILFPPLLFIIIGMLVAYSSIMFNIKLPNFVQPIYLFFVGYLMIGLIIILWSDFKRMKNL